MHIEVQVALNFVISYLYNKLPRRRVNIFGEELEKALKDKFQGHWYPDRPFRGSAFRCLKTGSPVDRVLERAARESGVPVEDVLENLPRELAVWVDPGEVSYRIGEKGQVKVLFSEKAAAQVTVAEQRRGDDQDDREVTKTFNPEAQCFRPIDSVSGALSALTLSPGGKPFCPTTIAAHSTSGTPPSAPSPTPFKSASPAPATVAPVVGAVPGSGTAQQVPPPFIPRSTQPLTFTTATFAQTKFGSTKLKTSSKRANRMSPTEFSNYIKQRAMQQQLHQQQQQQQQQQVAAAAQAAAQAAAAAAVASHQHSPAGRALSPDPSAAAYYFPLSHHYHPPPFAAGPRANMDSSLQLPFEPSAGPNGHFFPGAAANGLGGGPGGQSVSNGVGPQQGNQQAQASSSQDKLDTNWPYPGQYQHLLVAN